MTVEAVDLGFVSASAGLADFYRSVFDLEALDTRVMPLGTVHRFALGPVTLKILVPVDAPTAATPPPRFWDQSGLRYITLWLGDLAATVDRWVAAGGTVAMPPTELRPGVTTALLLDPDGNTIEAMHETAVP